jgi:hypothetical protein
VGGEVQDRDRTRSVRGSTRQAPVGKGGCEEVGGRGG